jgi:hypothetical protein
MKFLKLLNKNKQLGQLVSIFRDENASQDDVDKSGQCVIVIPFINAAKSSEQTSLDVLRYELFAQSISKIGFNLASLPPTTAAAHQHSLRTYHQVQLLYGKEKNLKWGWKNTNNGLGPITTTKEPAPDAVLNTDFCKCAKGCGGRCSYRQVGIQCSTVRYNCKGQSCTESTPQEDLMDVIKF